MSHQTIVRPTAPGTPPGHGVQATQAGVRPTGRRRRRLRWLALIPLVPLAVGGFGLWYFVLRHDAPSKVSLDTAANGVRAPASAASSAGTSTTGTWTVDPTITNADGTGSFAGFRVDENLVGVGATTAVGRSSDVTGTVTVDGTTVTAASFTVNLKAITSNDSRRDGQIQSALATSRYPTATFVLTQPIDAGSVPAAGPADGQAVTLPATGDLTIHGVTNSVTIQLQAQLTKNVLVVVGTAPITFSDYGVRAPTAPIVASVDDHGTIELQLYFTRS